MKFNKWTVGLAAIGVVSLASAARADEAKMSQMQTALSNTTLSGYVDVAAQWNLGQQYRGGVPSYSYSGGKGDGFNLNAIDLALDKPLDEGSWASGYHVDLQLGPDYPSTSYPIRQGYVALRTPVGNGIDWKVGVFDSILGYESTSSPLDPNYTRSYGYTIEPTTLTGVLATYKVVDALTLQAGVADAWTGVNGRLPFETQKAYLGAITLTAPDSWGAMKGATFNAGVINAPGSGSSVTANSGRTSWYAGATLPTPSAKLKVGAAFDWLDLHNGNTAANPSDDNIWVGGLYATFQATDKLNFNIRGEYLANNGTVGTYATTTNGRPVGNAAEELTATVQYSLWANVISRVELRWDHVEHGTFFDNNMDPNNSGSNPPGFKSGYHNNAVLLALNLIYQF
jgi:hypothetical protein